MLCYRSVCCVTGACVVLQEHVLCYRSVCCVQISSEYNTNVLEYEYDYFEHA